MHRSKRSHSVWLVALFVLTVGCRSQVVGSAATEVLPMSQEIETENESGGEGFVDALHDDAPVHSGKPPLPIRPGEAQTAIPRAMAEGAGVLRPFVNDALNGRLPYALPAGEWRVRWQSNLDPDLSPAFVLQSGERIVLQGAQQWALFDTAGKPLAHLLLGDSDIVLDPTPGLFYLGDGNAFIAARHLSDGKETFAVLPRAGKNFDRTFLARRGPRFVLLSTEKPDPFQKFPSSHTHLEVQNIGEPPEIDSDKLVTSTRREAHLTRQAVGTLAALHGDTLAVATPNHLYQMDLRLHLHTDFTGDFQPLSLSLDETGHLYLVVHTSGKTALWVITPTGEKVRDCVLPEGMSAKVALPPVVGYDHRVYVVDRHHIVAVDSDGKVAWSFAPKASCAGAVVTTDDRLLVTSDATLLSFDPQGKTHTLWTAPGNDELTTPPTLTVQGEILVASAHHLYCLTSTVE